MRQFQRHVDAMAKAPTAANMRRVVGAAARGHLLDADLAYLASALAGSGRTRPRACNATTADVPSSGGPSSLTTLLCPLYLRALGFVVPKLGVPGRPAGGIDVMAQIPGYRATFTGAEFDSILTRVGYAHCLAQHDLAPLDARFFDFRQSVGAQSMAELAIASILAKKLAVGVKHVALDVRVAAHGNFGTSWATARENAKRFCRVSSLIGVHSVCVLTDGSIPCQPFLGRGESLWALHDLFEGAACPLLNAHANLCFRVAAAAVEGCPDRQPNWNRLKTIFSEHIVAQGGDYSSFEEKVDQVRRSPRFALLAQAEGFLKIDLGALRSILVDIQARSSSKGSFPDPCGLVLRLPSAAYVWPGDVVASVRMHRADWATHRGRLTGAFGADQSAAVGRFYEEVRHA
jgi:thymidine phosphorylase